MYHGRGFSREGNPTICDRMDEPRIHYAESAKPLHMDKWQDSNYKKYLEVKMLNIPE